MAKLDSWFNSDDGLGSGFSDVNTEFFPVSSMVLLDGIFYLSEDVSSVDQKIFTDMVGDGLWASHDFDHLGKFCPVSLEVRAVRHARLDNTNNVGDLLNTIDDLSGIL